MPNVSFERLDIFTDEHRSAQERVRGQVWGFYSKLKQYKQEPSQEQKEELSAEFDSIFSQETGFVALDQLLKRLRANRDELLRVLDYPSIPLHTNGSENDIRCVVTRRKVSAGTRSDAGRDCRDAFLGILKTCKKLGISFWNYLGDRLHVSDAPKVPNLADLVRRRLDTG
jgi:hypothetical protein